MPTDGGGEATLAPDDAFALLGNETRMEILETLADAEEPLTFSELYDRVGGTDSGNFNYHLEKLLGHFLEATDDGYGLRRAGERVVEAVVSGAVTDTPVIEPTQIEWPCSQCGTQIVVSYQEEWVAATCPECPGLYGVADTDDPIPADQRDQGYLGGASLPPAAIRGRDAAAVHQAALAWDFLERIALSNDICPRCSAVVDRALTACADHDASDGLCQVCDRRHQELFTVECPNCPLTVDGLLPAAVHGYPAVLDFVTRHGFNPVVPTAEQWEAMSDAQEVEVISLEPLEVRITYSLAGDVLSLTVDEDLAVTAVEEGRPADPA